MTSRRPDLVPFRVHYQKILTSDLQLDSFCRNLAAFRNERTCSSIVLSVIYEPRFSAISTIDKARSLVPDTRTKTIGYRIAQ